MIGSLIGFAIPLGFGVSMLTCALLAHRGQRFWGTWTMLISSALAILGVIAIAASTILQLNSAGYSSSESSGVLFALISLSILGYACGFVGICKRWPSISQTADDLEAQAAILAAERD